ISRNNLTSRALRRGASRQARCASQGTTSPAENSVVASADRLDAQLNDSPARSRCSRRSALATQLSGGMPTIHAHHSCASFTRIAARTGSYFRPLDDSRAWLALLGPEGPGAAGLGGRAGLWGRGGARCPSLNSHAHDSCAWPPGPTGVSVRGRFLAGRAP